MYTHTYFYIVLRITSLVLLGMTKIELTVDGHRLVLSTALDEPSAIFSEEWLASEIWPAAFALIRAMEQRPEWRSSLRCAHKVVDLGSGTGACGIAAAALGARHVLLTDKSSSLSLLRQNANECEELPGIVEVCALSWQSDWTTDDVIPHGVDVVLASDCLNPIYGSSHATALAATIAALLCRATSTGFALVAQTVWGRREAETEFLSACRCHGLELTAATQELTNSHQETVMFYEMHLAASVLNDAPRSCK